MTHQEMTYQDRVRAEYLALETNIKKLAEAVRADNPLKIDDDDLKLLVRQLHFMEQYKNVLEERIERFK